ncbi:MAG: murein biosynthesis integral membrane protein MurJ [Gemmatimonadota bacterium]
MAAGILLSRVTGLLRDAAIAAFLGTRLSADAYYAALRIPNVLRNLLGEGTLSAAFVPVYSESLERSGAGSTEARRLATGVWGVVLVASGLLSGLGILLAPWLTRLIAPGLAEDATHLTTSLVRILFPMSGVMILGAWCLGVLNSHRRFFLPFFAPVLWNLAQVAGLLLGARLGWDSLVHVLAWSTLAGAVLQVAVQLPGARRLAGSLRPVWAWEWEPLRRVVRNMVPVVSSQGIFQISSYIDLFLASFLPVAAISSMGYAQRIVYLPLSLFGISVAAASLPEMSREVTERALRQRLVEGFFQILFFVLPAAIVFLLFGDLVVQVLFERGQFGRDSTLLVSAILMAYSIGLVASSCVKLFASGFHALQDTRTPMRIAAVSVGAGIAAGAALMWGMKAAGYGAMSAAGLALGGAFGAWLNLSLLWRGLADRTGTLFPTAAVRGLARLAAASIVAAGAGMAARHVLTGELGGESWVSALGILLGTLAAGGVPYLLIARRPPIIPIAE